MSWDHNISAFSWLILITTNGCRNISRFLYVIDASLSRRSKLPSLLAFVLTVLSSKESEQCKVHCKIKTKIAITPSKLCNILSGQGLIWANHFLSHSNSCFVRCCHGLPNLSTNIFFSTQINRNFKIYINWIEKVRL